MSSSSNPSPTWERTKHPGIYVKGDRYLVRWRHRGNLKAKSFRTLSEARQFKNDTAQGNTQAPARTTFKRYALAWVDGYTGRTARGLSDSTRESYRDALTRLAIPFFGTVPLDDIDPPMLREFFAHLVSKRLAPASVRRAYAPVRALLATAYEDGLLKTNPALGVRVIVADNRTAPPKPKHLTAEQTKALLGAMPEEWRDLTYFLVATGCRISEALGVLWGDVGPDSGGRIALTIRKSKTVAGRRTITLQPEVVRQLTQRRTAARFNAADDPIFPSSTGTPMDTHNFRRIFRRVARAAGVPWATPHKLRHTLGTMMDAEGHGAAAIAAQLGHADGGVLALRTYIHAERPDVDFIDAVLR